MMPNKQASRVFHTSNTSVFLPSLSTFSIVDPLAHFRYFLIYNNELIPAIKIITNNAIAQPAYINIVRKNNQSPDVLFSQYIIFRYLLI